jgi:ADP-ribosylation factor GTPase-activating protein 1
MSSANAPTLSELQENPMAALSKGWSLLSAAVVATSRVVSENVIQPGMEKVRDPNLQASVGEYLSEAQKRAQYVGSTANHWTKNQFGVDVAESVGGVVGTVKDKIGGGPSRSGYGSLTQDNGTESSSLYRDDTDDFFGEYSQGGYDQPQHYDQPAPAKPAAKSVPAPKKDDFDEWQDF